jgi:type II secretory pathway pseudopilin PulG
MSDVDDVQTFDFVLRIVYISILAILAILISLQLRIHCRSNRVTTLIPWLTKLTTTWWWLYCCCCCSSSATNARSSAIRQHGGPSVMEDDIGSPTVPPTRSVAGYVLKGQFQIISMISVCCLAVMSPDPMFAFEILPRIAYTFVLRLLSCCLLIAWYLWLRGIMVLRYRDAGKPFPIGLQRFATIMFIILVLSSIIFPSLVLITNWQLFVGCLSVFSSVVYMAILGITCRTTCALHRVLVTMHNQQREHQTRRRAMQLVRRSQQQQQQDAAAWHARHHHQQQQQQPNQHQQYPTVAETAGNINITTIAVGAGAPAKMLPPTTTATTTTGGTSTPPIGTTTVTTPTSPPPSIPLSGGGGMKIGGGGGGGAGQRYEVRSPQQQQQAHDTGIGGGASSRRESHARRGRSFRSHNLLVIRAAIRRLWITWSGGIIILVCVVGGDISTLRRRFEDPWSPMDPSYQKWLPFTGYALAFVALIYAQWYSWVPLAGICTDCLPPSRRRIHNVQFPEPISPPQYQPAPIQPQPYQYQSPRSPETPVNNDSHRHHGQDHRQHPHLHLHPHPNVSARNSNGSERPFSFLASQRSFPHAPPASVVSLPPDSPQLGDPGHRPHHHHRYNDNHNHHPHGSHPLPLGYLQLAASSPRNDSNVNGSSLPSPVNHVVTAASAISPQHQHQQHRGSSGGQNTNNAFAYNNFITPTHATMYDTIGSSPSPHTPLTDVGGTSGGGGGGGTERGRGQFTTVPWGHHVAIPSIVSGEGDLSSLPSPLPSPI